VNIVLNNNFIAQIKQQKNSKNLINFIFQLTLKSKKEYGIILSELSDDYL